MTKKIKFLIIVLIGLISLEFVIMANDVSATKCAKHLTTIFCTTLGADTCSMSTDERCWYDFSFSSHSVCLVGDKKAYETCDSWEECKEDKCPTDGSGNPNINDEEVCQVSPENKLIDDSKWQKGYWDDSNSRCVQCDGNNRENKVCGDASNTYNSDDGTSCTKSGSGLFSTACGADASCTLLSEPGCILLKPNKYCDENGIVQSCPNFTDYCANGVCVAVTSNVLNLKITVPSKPVAPNSSSTITFKVTEASDGSNVSGATVAITSVSCGSLPNPGSVTNASGETTSTFTAPGVGSICMINAKATLDGFDDGVADASIAVTICSHPNKAFYDSNKYVIGDEIELWGVNRIISDDFYLCIYNPSGNLKKDKPRSSNSGMVKNITFTSNTEGAWKGLAVAGLGGCPNAFDASKGCAASTDVVECEDDGDCLVGYKCIGNKCNISCVSDITCTNSDCTETDPTSAEATTICVDAAGCVADTTTTSACCLKDEHCAGATPVCDLTLKQCVECATDADCAGTDVCFNNKCTSCSGEGKDPGNAGSCCSGLSYLDLDGDGIFVCTSACDPSAWFFCNPLRGTVENITQAGETMLGYILGLIGSVSLLFIIIAGMMYMTSAGNEERITSSKKILSGAVIGLMIALLAYGMLQVVMTVLNMV